MSLDEQPAGFEYEGRDYTASPGENLLQALLRQGAELPHSCRRGSCHTCVIKVEQGAVGLTRRIDPALVAAGCTLACVARPGRERVRLRRVHADELSLEAALLDQSPRVADGVFALDIAPMREMDYRAGQFLQVRGPDGQMRPYSLASRCEDDFFLTLHVRRIDGGRVSSWLCDDLQPGARLRLSGPFGNGCYDESMRERPLRLLPPAAVWVRWQRSLARRCRAVTARTWCSITACAMPVSCISIASWCTCSTARSASATSPASAAAATCLQARGAGA